VGLLPGALLAVVGLGVASVLVAAVEVQRRYGLPRR